MVESAANVGAGHLYLPDLPRWFLVAWYGLLLTAVCTQSRPRKQLVWLCLCGVTAVDAVGPFTRSTRRQPALQHPGHRTWQCSHCRTAGRPGHTGGCRSHEPRKRRAGDIVSHCLWQRGHRMINSIVVSHADVDHFNALGPVLTRFPVSELLVSSELRAKRFTGSSAVDCNGAKSKAFPFTLLATKNICRLAELTCRFFKHRRIICGKHDQTTKRVSSFSCSIADEEPFCCPETWKDRRSMKFCRG